MINNLLDRLTQNFCLRPADEDINFIEIVHTFIFGKMYNKSKKNNGYENL